MIDLAIGVVIGAAFGAVVTSFVNDILSPPLGLINGKASLEDLFVLLKYNNADDEFYGVSYPTVAAAKARGAITLNYGKFVQTVIYFFLIAISLFLFIQLIGLCYRKKEIKSTDWPCPKCKELVKEGAIRCSHCSAEPISPANG